MGEVVRLPLPFITTINLGDNMDYRNLYRYFVFNRAFDAWNKERFKRGAANVLIALSTKEYYTITELYNKMKRYNRGMALDVLYGYLRELKACDYINAEGSYPVKYSLTLAGRNALYDLERRCRDIRANR